MPYSRLPIDINYVRLPHSTIDFIDQIAPSNPLLRYSYEDHFIMRLGYTVGTSGIESFFKRHHRRVAIGECYAESSVERYGVA